LELVVARLTVRTLLAAIFLASTVQAQRPQPSGAAAEAVKARYRKLEVRIPMRDGVKLFTAIYVPKDSAQAWPILMDRTPYGVAPYGPDAYRTSLGPNGTRYLESGFIFVYQDARGRFNSEGEYTEMTPHKDVKTSAADVDESSDSSACARRAVSRAVPSEFRAARRFCAEPARFAAV